MKKNKILIIFLLIVSLSFITVNVYADDYSDDIYDGDYSLNEMLENYNIITFGKKDLDSQMTQNNFSKGGAKLFHINSQFLVNGILDPNNQGIRIDLNESKNNAKSFFKNNSISIKACGYRNGSGEQELCNLNSNSIPSLLYSERSFGIIKYWEISYANNQERYYKGYTSAGNYMNFDRLYDSIISEQSKIKKGNYITSEDGVAHIETGGEYYIDDINDISEIVFDNFEDNQDNLTVITINNTESINFPKIYASENNGEQSLVSTNDYMGMERPNSNYADYYVIDKYYGNIIWNIPNATYIKLASAPFIGHLVAPNADVYGPELHYAGAFLVNSLYLEGNSEAHYYPLTSTNIPYRSNPEPVKAELNLKENQGNIIFNNNVNNESLEEGMVVSFKVEAESDYLFSGIEIKDEEENIVEFREIGDREYEFTMPATNVIITPQFKEKNIKNIITNPKTENKVVLIITIMITSLGLGTYLYKKKESRKI